MATPQGNFSAYIPLKPTELKVGEIYAKWVDNYIKRGDAEKAARAKLLAEEKKTLGERFEKMKIDPFATITSLQDMGNDMFRKTADYVGTMRMMAEKDFENRHIYLNRAEKAINSYKTINTSFSNKDFIEKANAKIQAIQNKDVFLDNEDNDHLMAISAGVVSYGLDENTGEIYFQLPKDKNAKDDDLMKRYSVSEVLAKYSTPDEINMMYSNKSNNNNGFLDKEIPSVAKTMQDEWEINKDGNKTKGWAGFAKERATTWFDTTFGGYNANDIDVRLRQYSKTILKKNIESEDDYNIVKNNLIERIGAYVPQENKEDTKRTQAQIDGDYLENAIKRERLAEMRAERAMGYPSLRASARGGGSGDAGKNNNKVAISNVDGGIFRKVNNGNLEYNGGMLINLNNKEYVYGIKYPNKDGKGYHTRYAILGKDEKGRLGFEDWTSRGDIATRLRGYNYDPNMVERAILNGQVANPKVSKNGLSGEIKYGGAYKTKTEEEW